MALSYDDAEAVIDEFCKTYPQALTITYNLALNQEELYGPQNSVALRGRIDGSYRAASRRADFALANCDSNQEFERTLRHEILGHYGINTFSPAEKRAVLDGIVAGRNAPKLVELWAQVDQLYPALNDSRKAEEVFAFACENIEPQARADATLGAQSFKETCIDRSRPMQISDLINLTTMVAEGLHDRSRSQQNFPASDNAQFKIETAPRTSEYPVWLAVPPDDRDKARLSAGRLSDGRAAIAWNKEEKLWFARPGCDLDRITDWLPDPSRRAGGGDAESEFLDVLTQAGLVVKGMPVMDGSRQRVATVDDKHGKKSGVYCGFLDRRPAGWFINYHRADSPKDVTNWAATGGESDPITRLHIRAGAKQAQEDAARDRAVTYAKQTLAAKRLYDRLPAADPAHPYLVRKGIPPTPDIRQTRNGALVVPFFNASGTFKTLQYIPPEGEKFLFKDAPKQEHFLVVGGSLDPVNPILYAEGYATARSLNLATGLPVVMTIDAGNMVAVAKVLHQQYPDSRHLFMADFDHAKDVNKGLIMANEAAIAVGGQVLYPTFNDAEIARGFTDFNDLHQSRGLDAVREQTAPLIRPYEEVTTMPTDSNTQPPDNTAQKAATPAQETLGLDAAPAASIQVPDQSAPPQTRSAQPVASEASSVESQSPETAQVTEAPVGIDDAQVSTQPPLALSPAEQLASVEADPDASAIVDEQP
ncbi:DNA primase, partial [Pseudomonas syringae pv. tomato]